MRKKDAGRARRRVYGLTYGWRWHSHSVRRRGPNWRYAFRCTLHIVPRHTSARDLQTSQVSVCSWQLSRSLSRLTHISVRVPHAARESS